MAKESDYIKKKKEQLLEICSSPLSKKEGEEERKADQVRDLLYYIGDNITTAEIALYNSTATKNKHTEISNYLAQYKIKITDPTLQKNIIAQMVTICDLPYDENKEEAHENTIRELGNQYRDFSSSDFNGYRGDAAQIAASRGHKYIVKFFLQNHYDVNRSVVGKVQTGKTLLTYAAAYAPKGQPENIEMVKYLFENGANPNLPDTLGNTPLHYVVFPKNDLEMAILLLKIGANPHCKNSSNQKPSDLAVIDNPELKAILIFVEENFRLPTSQEALSTGLHEAAKILEKFEKDNFFENNQFRTRANRFRYETHEPPVQNKSKWLSPQDSSTLIRERAIKHYIQQLRNICEVQSASKQDEENRLDAVYQIINSMKGLSTEELQKHGISDVINIAKKLNPEIAEALETYLFLDPKKRNIIIDQIYQICQNPYDEDTEDQHVEAVKTLTSTHTRLRQEGTLIEIAMQNGHIGIVTFLLNSTNNINHKYDYGLTALHFAIHHNKIGIAQLLLKRYAGPNIQDTDGDSPLHFELNRKKVINYEMMLLLLKNGANPNLRDGSRDTPLHIAVYKGDIRAVLILLMHGADPRYQDAQNATPIKYLDPNSELYKLLEFYTNNGRVPTVDEAYKENLRGVATSLVYIDTIKGKTTEINDNHKNAEEEKDYKDANLLWPALYREMYACYLDDAIELIQNGADVNEGADPEHTPLRLAVEKYWPTIGILLIEKGAKVILPSGIKLSSLYKFRNSKFKSLLLEKEKELEKKHNPEEPKISIEVDENFLATKVTAPSPHTNNSINQDNPQEQTPDANLAKSSPPRKAHMGKTLGSGIGSGGSTAILSAIAIIYLSKETTLLDDDTTTFWSIISATAFSIAVGALAGFIASRCFVQNPSSSQPEISGQSKD